MRRISLHSIFFFLCVVLFYACGSGESPTENQSTFAVDAQALKDVLKFSQGDPFIETIKKSEFFQISGLENSIIETKDGTVLSIPKGAFRDANGNLVEKEISIEIADINSFEEQLNANINSPAGQNIQLNGGALYINATAQGAQLSLNKDAPIYVELTQEADPDMLIFEGIRNNKGEMQWINPKKTKKYLIPIDFDQLDFLPPGYEKEVESQLPFCGHTTANKSILDSLYYSFLPRDSSFFFEKAPAPEIQEYSSDYEQPEEPIFSVEKTNCSAINPASIQAIKTDKFSNTFLATKQFEQRLQIIHASRNQEIFELYTSNLTQNLSYCDSLASTLFDHGSAMQLKFMAFAKENWTNVENLPPTVSALGDYYSSQLAKIETEIKEIKKEYLKSLEQKSKEAQETVAEYKELLVKRQNYRMERHGCTLTKLGWTCPGIIIEPMEISITVKQGNEYDRVHVYTIYPSINSIFAWQSTDKVNFSYAVSEDNILIYRKYLKAKAIVVAYKDKKPYVDIVNFKADNEVTIKLKLKLKPTNPQQLSKMLRKIDGESLRFNKIKVDLEYQEKFYNEKQRIKRVNEKHRVINHLYEFVYDCRDHIIGRAKYH